MLCVGKHPDVENTTPPHPWTCVGPPAYSGIHGPSGLCILLYNGPRLCSTSTATARVQGDYADYVM